VNDFHVEKTFRSIVCKLPLSIHSSNLLTVALINSESIQFVCATVPPELLQVYITELYVYQLRWSIWN